MPESSIAQLFNIQQRYIRSVNLERDFGDPSALDGYIVTPEIKQMLSRIETGLSPDSSQRAWRITGDYGSGKSSFALLLAHLFGGNAEHLPSKLKVSLKGVNQEAQLLPVLVNGSREALGRTLLSALRKAILEIRTKGPVPNILGQIESVLERPEADEITASTIVDLIAVASDYASRGGRYRGLLIVLDELGKSLEYSALHPGHQDVFLLQALAEAAARSGKRPLYVVGLLHQGFNVYAESLSQHAQKEWEKVAGRFDELVLAQPLDQTSILIAEALSVKASRLPAAITKSAQGEMELALNLGWYPPDRKSSHRRLRSENRSWSGTIFFSPVSDLLFK
jgi:hypothetical protein